MSEAAFAPGVKGLLTPLYPFLNDKTVSEILINRPQEIFVEQGSVMRRFEIPTLTQGYLRRLFILIANENQQALNPNKPLLSGNLDEGSRVQLVLPPASQFETLSIRKHGVQTPSLESYFITSSHLVPTSRGLCENTLSSLYHAQAWPDFIKEALLSKKNIVISGATSSGKTTFLNSCLTHIPIHERLITLEDAYEIKAPHANLVRLKAFKDAKEHPLTQQDLLQAALRLRPDRLILGEIRGKEVFDFISACLTGHSAITTLHASHPKAAFTRMAQLYQLTAPMLSIQDIEARLREAIDVIIQLQKTQTSRQVVEVYYKDSA